MNASEAGQDIGKEALVPAWAGIWYRATIRNARVSHGRLDYLVEPVAGEGQAWVSAERVKVVEQQRAEGDQG